MEGDVARDNMEGIQNMEECVRVLWNGIDVLNQQISNGAVPLFTLQQQFRLLATKLIDLQKSVAMETTHDNRLQLPFRPVTPTPKGKLIGIIESLKQASVRGNSSSLGTNFLATDANQLTPIQDMSCDDKNVSCDIQDTSHDSNSNDVMLKVPPPPPPCAFIHDSLSLVSRAPPKYTPTKPLKTLFWKRLQYTSLELREREVIWKNISEPELLNGDRFEQLFARKVTNTRKDSLAQVTTVARQQCSHQPIRLLDGQRSQVLGILLNSLHIEIAEVERAILTFDLQTCELEALQTISEVLPTHKELTTIRNHLHSNPSIPLDKPEMFLYQLSVIPQFTSRLKCLLFSGSFAESACSLQTKLATLKRTCDTLCHSQGVCNVLGVILAFGNAMNSENKVRGQADGFQLAILSKLKDVKSADNVTHLLAYIVHYWVEHFDQHAGTIAATFPLPDPSDLLAASQIKFDQLNNDLEELTQQLGMAKSNLDKVLLSSPRQHIQPFKSRMELSLKQAESTAKCLKAQLSSVRREFTQTVEFFCVSGNEEVTPEEFFSLWCSFVKDFHHLWKMEQREMAKKRQREQQESRIANAPVKPVSNTSLKWRLKQKASKT